MAATLGKLIAQHPTVKVPVGDDSMTVTYNAHAFDQATEEELSDFQAAGKGATMAVEMALKLVRSWDLKREETDKEPIPLTREELRTVPTTVLSMIFEAIAEDRRPNAET